MVSSRSIQQQTEGENTSNQIIVNNESQLPGQVSFSDFTFFNFENIKKIIFKDAKRHTSKIW